MSFDIEKHIEKVEKGADYEVDLGEGNAFNVQVRKASIRDPKYFKAQAFLISLASVSSDSAELKDSMEEGVSSLSPDRVEELTSSVVDQFKVDGFADNLGLLSEYVIEDLVVGWTGIEKSGTNQPLPFDKDLFTKLITTEPQLAIQIFGFALNAENYGTVVGDAEKN